MTHRRHQFGGWRGIRWQQTADLLIVLVHCGCSDTKAHLPHAASQTNPDDEVWLCFLGPHRTGVSSATGLPEEWPTGGPPICLGKKGAQRSAHR